MTRNAWTAYSNLLVKYLLLGDITNSLPRENYLLYIRKYIKVSINHICVWCDYTYAYLYLKKRNMKVACVRYEWKRVYMSSAIKYILLMKYVFIVNVISSRYYCINTLPIADIRMWNQFDLYLPLLLASDCKSLRLRTDRIVDHVIRISYFIL